MQRVAMVLTGQREPQVQPDPQEPQVQRVAMVLTGQREQQVIREQLAQLAQLVQRVPMLQLLGVPKSINSIVVQVIRFLLHPIFLGTLLKIDPSL